LRAHVNDSHTGFLPSGSWLASTCSKICDECGTGITSVSRRPVVCSLCRNRAAVPRRSKRHEDLPRLQFNAVSQLSLGLDLVRVRAGLPGARC
jgi:hypothetical protein